jgi:single-strand DNA-binding protein
MSSLNKVFLIGRCGRDPEIKYFQNGDAACNFSIATSESWKDKNTGEKKEKTEWHKIVAYRKLAEICGKYLCKGKQVYLAGRLQTRSYEKDGNTYYTTEILISDMIMLGDGGRPAEKTDQPTAKTDAWSTGPMPDDDIPF